MEPELPFKQVSLFSCLPAHKTLIKVNAQLFFRFHALGSDQEQRSVQKCEVLTLHIHCTCLGISCRLGFVLITPLFTCLLSHCQTKSMSYLFSHYAYFVCKRKQNIFAAEVSMHIGEKI
jgi:hypothetical protein